MAAVAATILSTSFILDAVFGFKGFSLSVCDATVDNCANIRSTLISHAMRSDVNAPDLLTLFRFAS